MRLAPIRITGLDAPRTEPRGLLESTDLGAISTLERHTPDVMAAPAASRSGDREVRRRGLIGMGVAGGLVPSPSALVVLLSAIALGRTAFGVLLVIGYGLGMAATLTIAGLLLVRVRDRIQHVGTNGRLARAAARWAGLAAVATACLVLVVGLGVALNGITRI